MTEEDPEFNTVLFQLLYTEQIRGSAKAPDTPDRARRTEIIQEFLRQEWPLLFCPKRNPN